MQLDVLLLLALPAAGKSELRRYLEHLDPETAASEMCLGPTVQLDDYPYVHLMRRAAQEMAALGADPVFFDDPESPWRDKGDWLTLIHLINEDFTALTSSGEPDPVRMLERIDGARIKAGIEPAFRGLTAESRAALEKSLAPDIARLVQAMPAPARPGDTIVIEFARGAPQGAGFPLSPPLGYAASLTSLDDVILSRAAILYVWVEPAESRRRNRERVRPAGDASTLYHGVPEAVMQLEYGSDDITWLESQARRTGTIPVGDRDIPLVRFDNRQDRTSFLRDEPERWPPEKVRDLHRTLSEALCSLARVWS